MKHITFSREDTSYYLGPYLGVTLVARITCTRCYKYNADSWTRRCTVLYHSQAVNRNGKRVSRLLSGYNTCY